MRSKLLSVILPLFIVFQSGCTVPARQTEIALATAQPADPTLEKPTLPPRAASPLPSEAALRQAEAALRRPPAPLPPTSPAPAALSFADECLTPLPPRSVFLISWDGARADLVDDLMAEGALPHFSALALEGLRAQSSIPPDPPLTFPVHSCLVSGSLPAGTGIVSNAYHDSIDSFYWYRSSDEEPAGAEPLWVTASRAGFTTATIAFPGSSLSRPHQMADLTIDYGIRDAYSRQTNIPLEAAQVEAAQGWDNFPPSFSPPLQGTYRIPEIAQVDLLVTDSTEDGARNYDTILLWPKPPVQTALAGRVGKEALRLQVGEWGSLVLQPGITAGADFLVQEITDQEVTIYHTGVYHTSASPRRLLEELNRKFGFFPSGADAYALEHGWITAEDYLHLIERASLWKAEVSAWLYTAYHPHLLFAWQENFDAAGHVFLLEDVRQPGYSSEQARKYAGYYRQAAQISDQALGRMLAAVDLDSTALLMVSDHGMAPAHTRVYVNTVLEQAGLLKLDSRDYVVVEKSKALAVASGGAVHVYINLSGREQDGIVPPEAYSDIQQQIIRLLSGLDDPRTGEPVFARTLPRQGLAALGLDHPHSGDVFAQANPGYSLDGWRGNDEVFVPLESYGQHGYDSSLPEMQGIFIAAGSGVPALEEKIPPVRIIDIAPTITALLGIEPAPTMDGDPIPAFSVP